MLSIKQTNAVKSKGFSPLHRARRAGVCRILKKISGFIHTINIFAIYNMNEKKTTFCKGDLIMDARSELVLQVINIIMGIIRSLIKSGRVEL